jgi:cobalt/nickel transport system permease protein
VNGLDRYTGLDSFIHSLDARSKLIGFTIPILLIASTPRHEIRPYPFYFALIACLLIVSRVPVAHVLWRCAVASPFILMTSAVLLAARGSDAALPALSIALKAYASVALMTVLAATTKFHDLLRAMRSLGAPEALALISNLMIRYIFLLQEEYRRMERARRSRTVSESRIGYTLYGRQFALLFIRSWDRAERVHSAMLARGFDGSIAAGEDRRLRAADFAFALATCTLFLIVRFSPV